MLIKGNSHIFALVGNNISHSLSPEIHNFLIKQFNIKAVYIPFEIKSDFESFIKIFKNCENFKGLNITIPYKEIAYKFTNINDQISKQIGSINTIKKNSEGKIEGINTDYSGFYHSLTFDLEFDPTEKNIVVLGSGGTAKTVIHSLIDKVNSVTVVSRNKRNIDFDKKITWQFFENNIKCLDFPDADLIVNATPLGLYGEDINLNWDSIKESCSLFDLLYIKSNFIKIAEKSGLNCVNGLNMLICQAIKSFEYWHNLTIENKYISIIEKEVINA